MLLARATTEHLARDTEPNPYNPSGNLQVGQAPALRPGLNNPTLPLPRLSPDTAVLGAIEVPAFTDFKLHDICSGPDDPNAEPLDMQEAAGSPGFIAGNRKFFTRRLWDCYRKSDTPLEELYDRLACLIERSESLARPQRLTRVRGNRLAHRREPPVVEVGRLVPLARIR